MANNFAVVGSTPPLDREDSLLKKAEILQDVGRGIRFFGADPQQATGRLQHTHHRRVTDEARIISLPNRARQVAGTR